MFSFYSASTLLISKQQGYSASYSDLEKGGYMMLEGGPCKIVQLSTKQFGKNREAKVHVVGINIFTGKKVEDVSPASYRADIPYVSYKEYTLVCVHLRP